MNFKSYRESMGWTLEQAATLLSTPGNAVDASTVRKHEVGQHVPRPDMAERYETLTGGKVTAADFHAAYRAYHKQAEGKRRASG